MNALCRATCLAGWLLSLAIVGLSRLAEAQQNTPPLHQQINELVAKRLAELKIDPAIVSSDSEFVRRVSLDLTGVIPTAKQARAFLDDSAPDKRQRLLPSGKRLIQEGLP